MNHSTVAKEMKRIIIQSKYPIDGDICPICYEDLYKKFVKHTSCGHRFCCHCLTKWQQNKDRYLANCPCCRTLLYTPSVSSSAPKLVPASDTEEDSADASDSGEEEEEQGADAGADAGESGYNDMDIISEVEFHSNEITTWMGALYTFYTL
jgi:hypothetical protein